MELTNDGTDVPVLRFRVEEHRGLKKWLDGNWAGVMPDEVEIQPNDDGSAAIFAYDHGADNTFNRQHGVELTPQEWSRIQRSR